MKSRAFRYFAPTSVEQVLEILVAEGTEAALIAGGQSLVPMMNMRIAAPETLVDLNRVTGLAGIEKRGDELQIGAMTRYVDIERSLLVRAHAPLLILAIPHIAHAAIRNRGTIGGSLGLADPAAELPACMLALGARIALASQRGIRWVPAKAYFHGLYQTERQADEVIVKVGLPLGDVGTVHAFDELARRHGDYALVGVAAELTLSDGRVERARLALLGIGSRAILALNAATAIRGGPLDDAAGAAAGEAIDADLQDSESEAIDGFRRRLAGVLVQRVLAQAARRASPN